MKRDEKTAQYVMPYQTVMPYLRERESISLTMTKKKKNH